ncbi:MAG: zinc metallopeptidase [Kiritimatiellae bacterium]|nr:zinc metallopeptidase [Kiritimatiellia bacterium]
MHYMVFMLPAILLGLIAQVLVQSTFRKYSRQAAASGMTGAQAAARLMQAEGLDDVRIERARGFLSDHYDPRTNTLRLSEAVYDSPSLSAIGVACHEAGHALQQAHRYAPLAMRSALVPVASIGSSLGVWVIIAGLLLGTPSLYNIGILLFLAAVLFTLVTLPVEWNASARAKALMTRAGIVTQAEQPAATKVLNAAFLTYVAAAVSSIMTLLYYLGLGRRR